MSYVAPFQRWLFDTWLPFMTCCKLTRMPAWMKSKLAFKRRALQVHPDKGGSKEQFHLVYQALETLADPKARKTYDSRAVSLTKPTGKTTTATCRSPFTTCGVRHERTKAPGKAQAKKDTARSKQTSCPPKMGQSGGLSDSSELQTKILIRIHRFWKIYLEMCVAWYSAMSFHNSND